MPVILTTKQMRNLEDNAFVSGQVSGVELMERAGQGVVNAIFKRWPKLNADDRHAVVLCGPGNNGGDGYVVARLLADKGWNVCVKTLGEPAKLPPDAAANYSRWRAMDVQFEPDAPELGDAKLIVDALFGIGLTRPITDRTACAWLADVDKATTEATLASAQSALTRTVAIDCPSGLDADTGLVVEDVTSSSTAAARSMLTVTFHSPKPGHFLKDGPFYCGSLEVVDIGLADNTIDVLPRKESSDSTLLRYVTRDDGDRASDPSWPLSLIGKCRGGGHKYSHGHAVILGGDCGSGGAARLAARSALRIGAGLVTVVCPPDAIPENAARLDAIMLSSLSATDALSLHIDKRVNALCLGPGMGVGEGTAQRVFEALAHRTGDPADLPTVILDADALSSFASSPDRLFDAAHPRTVLTPHEGEFARLFPDLSLAERGGQTKVDVVREAAHRAGCLVLLKGEVTVIAAPCGTASLHAACYARRAPWLATAGAGDVLAGLIAGLGASGQDIPMLELTEAAVWLHVEAARAFGPGLIAEDLPEMLPQVLAGLYEVGRS